MVGGNTGHLISADDCQRWRGSDGDHPPDHCRSESEGRTLVVDGLVMVSSPHYRWSPRAGPVGMRRGFREAAADQHAMPQPESSLAIAVGPRLSRHQRAVNCSRTRAAERGVPTGRPEGVQANHAVTRTTPPPRAGDLCLAASGGGSLLRVKTARSASKVLPR